MAKLTLTITGDISQLTGPNGAFAKIRSEIAKIEGSPIKVTTEYGNLDQLAKKLNEVAAASKNVNESEAKRLNAEARKLNAETRAAESAAKRAKKEKALATAIKETTQAVEQENKQSVVLSQNLKMVEVRVNAVRQKMMELSLEYYKKKSAQQSVVLSQNLFNNSLKLTVSRVNEVRVAIANLAREYLTHRNAFGTQPLLPAYQNDRELVWSRYGDWRDTATGSAWYATHGSGYPSGGYQNVRWDSFTEWAHNYYNAAPSTALDFVYNGRAGYVPNWTWGSYDVTNRSYTSPSMLLPGHVEDNPFSGITEGAQEAEKGVSRVAEGFRSYTKQAKDATVASSGFLAETKDYLYWYFRWTLLSGAFQGIIRSIKEALNTLKEVDSQLVTIRKVTGFSDSQLSDIQNQAYANASKYGVGAADYLESVAQFARAGYKEQSAALAELSTKTQIVGDTTAETANQFLLSVDAAYKYNGSIEKLSKVLDGANEIDNKYATSIEKIAEGLGKVAPVAAQTHVDISELAAAIGTITAVTQRSGTEAATAFRALILNIVGDTKTEIDEGVTWTTGEIAGLRDVIKQFAPEAYKTAQALGTVIDPMEAIGGLAKSMEAGLLNEQKLMSMVSDIGGKLRTSQLLALVQNWDMYQSMLEDYKNALGSADKEVDNALNSWERKAARLKNAWTEFISHLVETNTIKGILDTLTRIVKILDTDFGRATITILAASAAIAALSKAIATLAGTKSVIATLLKLIPALNAVKIGAAGAAETVATLQTELGLGLAGVVNSPLFWITVVAGAIYGIVKLYDYLNVTAEEHAENVKVAQEQYNKLSDEIDSLNQKVEENKQLIADADADAGNHTAYIAKLKTENELLEAQIKLKEEAKRKEAEKTHEEAVAGLTAKSYTYDTYEWVNGVEYYSGELSSYQQITTHSEDIIEYAYHLLELADAEKDVSEELNNVFDTLLTLREGLDPAKEETGELTNKIADLSEKIIAWTDSLAPLEKELEDVSDTTETLNITLKDQVTIYNELKEKLSPLTAALSELNDKGYMTEKTMNDLIAAYPHLQKAISVTADGFVIEKSAIEGAITAQKAQYQQIYEEAAAAAQELLNAESAKKAGIDATTQSIEEQLMALVAFYTTAMGLAAKAGNIEEALSYRDLQVEARTALINLRNARENVGTAGSILGELAKGGTGSSKSSGGGSSRYDKITDEHLEYLKDNVDLLKSQLAILEGQDASVEDQVAKQKEIQDALHEEAEYLRSIQDSWEDLGIKQKDVNALSSEWLQIQAKITKLIEDQEKAHKTALEDALKSAKENALKPLQDALELKKAERDTAKDAREEEEKRLEVEKARIALENAQRERTVRYYNAATGQWEWGADAKNVQSAQDALENAEKSLADFLEEQGIQALENQISATEKLFDGLETSVDYAAQQMMNAGWTLEMATEYLMSLIGEESTAKQMNSKGGSGRGASIWRSGARSAVLASATQSQLVSGGLSATSFGGSSGTKIGTQYNGNRYYIDGMQIRNINSGTTIGQIAETARRLQLYA